MTPANLIAETRKFFDSPTKWTQRAFGRDKEGAALGLLDPRAVCWCVVGATTKVGTESNAQGAAEVCYGAWTALDLAAQELDPSRRTAASFNDSPTTKFEDVVELLTRAEKIARKMPRKKI